MHLDAKCRRPGATKIDSLLGPRESALLCNQVPTSTYLCDFAFIRNSGLFPVGQFIERAKSTMPTSTASRKTRAR